jgi:hypothetical protein
MGFTSKAHLPIDSARNGTKLPRFPSNEGLTSPAENFPAVLTWLFSASAFPAPIKLSKSSRLLMDVPTGVAAQMRSGCPGWNNFELIVAN